MRWIGAVFVSLLSCAPRAPLGGPVTIDARAPSAASRVPACSAATEEDDAQRIGDADALRDITMNGVAPKDSPTMDHADRAYGTLIVEDIPTPVRQSMAARERYLRDIPPECGSADRTDYAFYVGDRFYVYGHFREARALLLPLYTQGCSTSPLGYETWKRLIVMSNIERDSAQSRWLALAQRDHPCAGTHDEPPPASPWDDTIQVSVSAFEDAARAYAIATNAAAGPERNVLLRRAASMSEDALNVAPGHPDAPDAALRSASIRAQLGDVREAIHLYQRFLEHYGANIDQRAAAYDGLATLYLTLFAYDHAAEAFARLASDAQFDPWRRAKAARDAMDLYSALGDRKNLTRMHDVATSPALHPSDGDRARADYLLASFDFSRWIAGGSKPTGDAIRRAIAALTRFHDAYQGKLAAAPYVLEAASRVATMNASRSSHVAARSPESPGIIDVVAPTGLPAPSP